MQFKEMKAHKRRKIQTHKLLYKPNSLIRYPNTDIHIYEIIQSTVTSTLNHLLPILARREHGPKLGHTAAVTLGTVIVDLRIPTLAVLADERAVKAVNRRDAGFALLPIFPDLRKGRDVKLTAAIHSSDGQNRVSESLALGAVFLCKGDTKVSNARVVEELSAADIAHAPVRARVVFYIATFLTVDRGIAAMPILSTHEDLAHVGKRGEILGRALVTALSYRIR